MILRPPIIQHTNTEKLAYWFFRLNGCLTIENFIVHPDQGSDQRTEADILGVRFPYREELYQNPMTDHSIFTEISQEKPLIFIAEVKSATCRLNGPWTDSKRKNIQRVLKAIGAIPSTEVETAANIIYKTNRYDSAFCAIRLFGLGDNVGEFEVNFPNAIPVTWDTVLRFIHHRFQQYHRQKQQHPTWDDVGQELFTLVRSISDEDEFIRLVRAKILQQQPV
jgi:hypothetical protein